MSGTQAVEPAIAGRKAVVTGAGSGIGRAVAEALGRAGADVALVGRDRARLEATASAIDADGGDAPAVLPADLAQPGSVDDLVATLLGRGDALGILVHAAGMHVTGRTADLPPEVVAAVDATNVDGPMALTRGLLPALRAGAADVAFILSSAVRDGYQPEGAYAASKRALRDAAAAFRAEVNPDGIRVLAVYPGRTATPMQAAITAAEGRTYRPERLLQPADVAAMIVASIALPRTAEVTDLHLRPFRKPEP